MHHVIIGGGPAATNAIEAIRQFDGGASAITLVCDEPAHSRMALPHWLAGSIPEAHTHTGDAAYFERLGVATRFGVRVTAVDPKGNTVGLSDGSRLAFDDLLIATGSSPVQPPIPGAELPGVQPLWSIEHTARALKSAESVQADGRTPRVVLVGAGFIGFIVLNAMFKRKWQLTVIEREAQVLPRMLDTAAASHVQRWLAAHDVAVHCGTTVKQIRERPDGTKAVELANGKSVDADIVILATGIRPNLDLLKGSGIATGEAIRVDDRMRTNFAHVYAAGDAAEGPVLYGEGPAVHPIQPTAVDHGRVAGANMAGNTVHYPGSLLMNVVDICGIQGASFGHWNDAAAEATTIDNPDGYIYRKLLWTGDRITGAIFAGQADDLGMLTDVGMVKGMLQTQAALGPWKKYLRDNPFDIRRAYVACGVAAKLAGTTLLGRASQPRDFRYGGAQPTVPANPAHAVFVARA